ncbi:MAG: ABC transporter permease, partial [Alphaproteobacteria bacterium]
MKTLSKFLGPLTPLVGVAILLLVWQIAFWVEVVDHVLLPSPASMFVAVWQGMTGGQLLFDFFRTIERTA